MERGKTDINPIVLKFGLAVAVSLGGMIYKFLRNKRIKKPSKSTSDCLNSSSDWNNQVKESWGSKSDNYASNSCQFDPLATDKHDQLNNSNPDLSPNSWSNTDKDSYLLPEFNDLVKEFDTTTMKTNKDLPISDAELSPEKEIKNLRNTVKNLKERERNLEIQLLEYYGLKEQQTAVMELQNRLKLNNLEAKLFSLKIEALQTDNKRLQAQMADYAKVVTDLEAAKAKIKVLKKRLRSESVQNKETILDLQQRVEKMQEDDDSEIELNLRKLKDLEEEAEELRKSNYSLEVEKSELGQRLEDVQILATSVLEDDESEKLKEESERLKKEKEDLTKEIERLQADRCGDVEELVYLRWINACLRYELRNHQAGPGKTMARDLSKTLSPKSEDKAKQLIVEYADKEGLNEKGINVHELDSDQWSSSQASNLTDSGELDESFVSYPSPQKTNKKFFGKLVKLLRRKDSGSSSSHGGNHHHHRQHSRNSSSLERTEDDTNSYSDYSFGNLGNSSKHSMDSQRSIYRQSDVGVHKRIDSIAEGGGIGGGSGGIGGGGGSDSPSSTDGRKTDLMKYAEVLKDSPAKSPAEYRRRSTLFSSF